MPPEEEMYEDLPPPLPSMSIRAERSLTAEELALRELGEDARTTYDALLFVVQPAG